MNQKQVQHKKAQVNKQKPTKKAAVPIKIRKFYWMPALCMILAFVVYSPVFNAGFVNWDDDDYVLKNHSITSFENLKEIITQPVQGNFHPLTMLTLAMNYAISGQEARSYHSVNLLIHLLNILLVFLFVKRLTGGKPWLAFIAALLFAVHPLHVESVAWVSERKDLLYAFFFLAGLLLYLRYSQTRKISHYLYVFGLFILSLLSKPAAVIFPVVLLAIDYYNGRLKEPKTYYEKIPFLLLSFGLGVLTLQAQKLQGAVGGADLFPLHFRFFFGFYGIMMYIVKTIWPFNLCAFYSFPPVNNPLPPVYYLSPLVGVALLVALVFSFRKYKLIAFAILFYLINLVLVLQFLPVGSAVIADRYSYLPLIGGFLIPGYYFQKWIDTNNGKVPVIGLSILVVVSIILSVLTFRQSATWKDSASLWDNAIRIAPSSRAYTNRGLIYKREANPNKALEMYNNAIKLNKVELDALINRGNIYFNREQFEQAIADYISCLAIDSTKVLAIENRGAAFGAIGKYDLAIADLNKAIQINPKTENGYANRAYLYSTMHRDKEAIADFYKHMEVNHSESADILNSIALSYMELKQFDKALKVLIRAIELESKGAFYLNRSIAFKELGRKAEARADALKAESLGMSVDKNYMNSLGQ